jgi:anti-sigma factor RsiW
MTDPTVSHASGDAPEPGLPPGLSPELLMRFLDGELPPEERVRVEGLLAGATEVQRDLLVYRQIHQDLSEIRLRTGGGRRSVWDRVHQRLTRPMGWILLGSGVAAWAVYLAWLYLSSATPSWEKLMSSAVVIGILLLFASVIHERYREWLTDPYRDVER